ncbi:WD40 repeat domain-containing serine/threonine protein kinase [Rubripirellula reticaptiva]|uniref:Serine/threonine-protein kinase PrkC n=1 Tax=Rubripirellula reticaptiva TaxID=2528013 RepID=A0A5C6EUZ7_9BACT|nr:WD40 repeat domain-containing serine/threonine protein kinase [Rubripirellula reticaptiva]TWU51877.1 Serine/threonine-protein kinase PrkC [Rubripirellula reticaptiva]
MNRESNLSHDLDLLVDEIAEEFLVAVRAGERTSVDVFVSSHPKVLANPALGQPLRQMLETLNAVHGLGGESLPADAAATKAVIQQPADWPKFDDYQLLRVAGRGGMGVVYEATQLSLSRRVALKVLPDHTLNNPSAVARFQQEARSAAQLHHTNIVPVFEIGNDGGHCFYAMQFIEGYSLDEVISQVRERGEIDTAKLPEVSTKEMLGGSTTESEGTAPNSKSASLDFLVSTICSDMPFDAQQTPNISGKIDTVVRRPGSSSFSVSQHSKPYYRNVAHIGRQIADGLQHAHERGVIHRDIKPANVVLDAEGVAWITDFGLAKTDDSDLTRDGDVVGTLRYMSPERFAGTCGECSDIYSLGVTLYEMLSLQSPFAAHDRISLIAAIRDTQPPLLRSINHRVPSDLQTIVEKAMEKDPRRRYQTAVAMSDDLDRFLDGRPIRARRVGSVERLWLWSKNNVALAAAIAAIAAVLVVGSAVSTWQAVRATKAEKLATVEAARATQAEQVQATLREKSEANEQTAIAQADRATKAEAIAVQEKEATRQALAKSQLDLAEKEFERGKFIEAQKILDETPESFRDSNWRFQQSHSRDFNAQLSIPAVGLAYQMQLLPRGDRFAASFAYNRIGIFSVSGQQVGDWIPTTSPRVRFGIDRAGNRLAFARSPNEVVMTDLATGLDLHKWKLNIGKIGHVMLSPDGNIVLAAGGTKLTAYSTQTDSPLWTQPYKGVAPAFSPDGRTVAHLVANTDLDLKIELLDTLTGAVRGTLETTADNPEKTTLQFDQTGDRLACLGGDEVILWNTQTGKKIRGLHFPGETVKWLSPDGDSVATLSGARIRLWESTTGRLLRSFNGAVAEIREFFFSPDGKMLLSSQVLSNDAEVNIWPTRLEEGIASVQLIPNESKCRSIIFDHDASNFYASADRSAGAWQTRGDSQTWDFTTTREIQDLAVHPVDGSIVLSEWTKKTFTHLSPTGESLESFGFNHGASLRFNRNGDRLLVVQGAFHDSKGGWSFAVLEYPSGNILQDILFTKFSNEIEPHQPFSAFCLEDSAVATAARVGGIDVWDWQAGKLIRQIDAAQTGSIRCLASSTDGGRLASGGPDRWIRVWDAATGQLQTAFRAHWEGVSCLKFSPDGREILSGSDLGTVRIHDAASGEERLSLYGLTTPVIDVDFSPDGKLIAAITMDAVTKVWDRELSIRHARLPWKPKVNGPLVAIDADGWQELLAPLDPFEVATSGTLWKLEDSKLFSPVAQYAAIQMPANLSGTSYQVRVVLRQRDAKSVFHVVLPVADRMCGFELEGRPGIGIWSGLIQVKGQFGNRLPGAVEGKQVTDAQEHELEVTVRLDDANAIITATLDARPLYRWKGPQTDLSQHKSWAMTDPGFLALGSCRSLANEWVVSKVKVKRLDPAAAIRVGAEIDGAWTTVVAEVDSPQRGGRNADQVNADGPTHPSLARLVEQSASSANDSLLAIRVAALQVWFGLDADYSVTRQRMLNLASDTTDGQLAERVAKLSCIRPLSDASQREAVLALAHQAMKTGFKSTKMHWNRLALGMAEYRGGLYTESAATLAAVPSTMGANTWLADLIKDTASFYRAMSLFQGGNAKEAVALFTETEARMTHLPADERNPLANDANDVHLVHWLAYKEAKALLAEASIDEEQNPSEAPDEP